MAFLYSNGTVIGLGTLDGGLFSGAAGINNSGQVVGTSDVEYCSKYGCTSSQSAFLYSGGSMQGLNMSGAAGINDLG